MISGYRLGERLFASQCSVIHRGVRESDSRPVVLKRLQADEPTSEQLAHVCQEFRMTRQASGEGVIEALALEPCGQGVALVLEDFGGRPLTELMASGPLEVRRFLHLAVWLAGTLGRLHQRGIVHGDLNPSHILYNPESDTLKLIDFGRAVELSRERMDRASDPRTDLYALGVTLHQLVTGQPPFSAEVPEAVSEIIRRLLAARPEERYPSAFALRAELERCARDLEERGVITPFPFLQEPESPGERADARQPENAALRDTLELRVKERTRELSETLEETQRQLVMQEKLASLGLLTAGIAHELKNPLNFINNFAQLSVRIVDELVEEFARQQARLEPASHAYLKELVGDLQQNAVKIHEHGTRANGIVRAMLQHASRSGPGQRELVDFNALVRRYVELARKGREAESAAAGVRFRFSYDETLGQANLVADEIGRVVINLTENALYAVQERKAREGGAYVPEIHISTHDRGEHIELRVRDNGTGIPVASRDRLFTPFFTTKPSGKGTGLGLSLSHNIIVRANGGTFTFETEEGQFTEFIVTLPRQFQPRDPEPPRPV